MPKCLTQSLQAKIENNPSSAFHFPADPDCGLASSCGIVLADEWQSFSFQTIATDHVPCRRGHGATLGYGGLDLRGRIPGPKSG
jgi:hypothetical protein